MNTITQQLKSRELNNRIPVTEAVKVAARYDAEREQTMALLRECEQNVGMYLGEKINQHLADMQGTWFNERDYHYERPVGEQ